MIIDSHLHLNDPKLYKDLDRIIIEAKENDVGMMIVSGYDKKSSLLAIEIANRFDGVYATIGIHPSEVKDADRDLQWIVEGLKEPKVIAVGEIGLDYYWDKSFKDLQIEFFNKQIDIARESNYPIVVHSREAALDTFNCLEGCGVVGVMHCFGYSTEMAHRFIGLGFLIGIGGVVSFKNASLRDVVRDIGVDDIITETDAPYLTPVPFRGKINYPKYTKYIVEEISRIKEIDLEVLKQRIIDNANRIFFKES